MLALAVFGLVVAVVAAGLAPMRFEVSQYGAVLGLLVLPIVVATFLVAWRQIGRIKRGQADPIGRRKIRSGLLVGLLALMIGTAAFSYVAAFSAGMQYELLDDGKTSIVTEFYSRDVRRARYQMVWGDGGQFVKDGPYVAWSREGEKVQEGSYRNGKREGQWIFWNDDRSLDHGRSGIYENDVRVHTGPTAPGDYPTDSLRLDSLDLRRQR